MSTKNSWKWKEKHQRAFHDLKEIFIKCVCLRHYLPNKKFHVQADASDMGICGILFQINDDSHKRIISLVSRTLSQCELHYTTTKKELLAIVYTITKFRTYIYIWVTILLYNRSQIINIPPIYVILQLPTDAMVAIIAAIFICGNVLSGKREYRC